MGSYTDWWNQGPPPVAGGDARVTAAMLGDDLDPLKDGGFTAIHKHVVAEDTPVNAVASTLQTALTGTNNDLVYTAAVKGAAGDDITIEYIDPAVETASETVTVVGTAISVTLRSVSGVLSTATEVKTAIEAEAEADALVTVANAGGNNGSGAVIALVATPLASGVNGTVGTKGELRADSSYLYLCLANNTVSGTSWRRFSVGSIY